MVEVYIGLGSNLGDPAKQLTRAISALKQLPKSRMKRVSAFYGNPPMGRLPQPDYVNAVARLETRLPPLALLERLRQIERRQGRVRNEEYWGSRTLDLDLLLYGRQRIRIRGLVVPHYGLTERDFVIIPLKEIAPRRLRIPGKGVLSSYAWRYRRHRMSRLKRT
jgi:2-amino-4-hydroxy-6-hydroxymethyldihydropteridine diphosphokinase